MVLTMTEDERLAKNTRIREQGKQTREKRKRQDCRVYLVKIDFSHLNETQKNQLKMLFVEAKWPYNDALTFTKSRHKAFTLLFMLSELSHKLTD